MTREIKRTLQAIKTMGMSARYNPETEEFRINFFPTDLRCKAEASAYYTADAADAIGTARMMLLNVREVLR